MRINAKLLEQKSKKSQLALLISATFFIAILLGISVVLLPIDLTIRASIVVLSVPAFFIAMGYRRVNVSFPEALLKGFGAALVVFQVCWPQYAFFQLSGLPAINPYSILAFGALVGFFGLRAYLKKFSLDVSARTTNVRILFVIYYFWMGWRVLTTMMSDYPLGGLAEIVREIVFIQVGFISGFLITFQDDNQQALLKTLIVCSVFVGFAGLLEALEHINRFVPLAVASNDGYAHLALKNIASDKIRDGAYRVQSTYGHPILFSQFCGAIIPLLLVATKACKGAMWKFLAFVAIIVCVVGIVKSGSRSGVLAAGVAFAILATIIWLRHTLKKGGGLAVSVGGLPLIVIALIIGATSFNSSIQGKTREEASSTATRQLQLSRAVRALKDSPIIGFGQGAALQLAGVPGSKGLLTMDIHYVSLVLDSGVPGLLLFVLLGMLTLVKAFKVSIFGEDDGLILGAQIAMVAGILVTLSAVAIQQNIFFLFFTVGVISNVVYFRNKKCQ